MTTEAFTGIRTTTTTTACRPGLLINRALREPQSLAEAAREANLMIAGWEADQRLLASLPQSAIGANVSSWLPALEARMPQQATAPVGRPAVGE